MKKNSLVIDIEPAEGFYLEVNGKVPSKSDVTPIKVEFCYNASFGPDTPQAYENLLNDVLKGDQSTFIRSDEIEQSWRIIDHITNQKIKPVSYTPGSYPSKADDLLSKDGRAWYGVA